MWQIKIVDAKVEAKHGLYPEEKILGQTFLVNIVIDFEMQKIETMHDTIDYVKVYNIMYEQMQKPTPLLEQVIEAIATQLKNEITAMQTLYISIKKLNPMFAKQLYATEVCYNWRK